MLFTSATSALALLAAFATAAPSPAKTARRSALADPAKRWLDPPGGPIMCQGQNRDVVTLEYIVKIPGDTLSNYGTGSSTLGGGLLDNLRGQCGVVTNWESNTVDGDPNTLYAYFQVVDWCGTQDVENSIWLANGMNYNSNCQWFDGVDWDGSDFDDWGGEAVASVIDSLIEAA